MNLQILLRKIRVALTPRECLLKTRLSNGAIVCGKNRPGYGGRGIYIFRDAIEPEFEHLEKFLDSSGVLVDIGANTGIYTLKAAKHFSAGGGTVVAVEPFPDMLASLHHSIQLNGFTNVRLRNFCASDKTGATTFWMNFNKPNSFSLLKRDENAGCLSTLAVALDDLFAWENLNRLDYLKIDAEGAEQQILKGGEKTISKYRPIIQVEVNIHEVSMHLSEYVVFEAPGGVNKIFVPLESPKREIPNQFGWRRAV